MTAFTFGGGGHGKDKTVVNMSDLSGYVASTQVLLTFMSEDMRRLRIIATSATSRSSSTASHATYDAPRPELTERRP
jgi:hypothetical protein